MIVKAENIDSDILLKKLKVTEATKCSVCRGLIKNGERQDEESLGGRRRTDALRFLCKMNPSQALKVRGMVVRDLNYFYETKAFILGPGTFFFFRTFFLNLAEIWNYIPDILPSSLDFCALCYVFP